MGETIARAREKLALSLIAGAAKLVGFYGYWPSFHDASVDSITIERAGPTVTIVFTTNDMVVKDVIMRRDQLARVSLRWYEVEELALQATDWGEANWVWDMNLAAHENGIRTELLPNEGIGGSILARRMEVLEVHPLEVFPGKT